MNWNWKVAALGLCLIGSVGMTGCDDDNNASNMPDAARSAFEVKYPGVSVHEWERENGYSVAEFVLDGFEAEAWFDENGWVMTETDINQQALPQAVIDAFEQSGYNGWMIDDIDRIERPDTPTIYVLEIEMGDRDYRLTYIADGVLVNGHENNGNTGGNEQGGNQNPSENPYLPDQTPNTIESQIQEMYPDAWIIETDREHNRIEVDILHGNIGKEVLFDTNGNWLQTSWDVRINNLPEAITAYVNANFAGYRIDDADYYETPSGNFYKIEVERGEWEQNIFLDADGNLVTYP